MYCYAQTNVQLFNQLRSDAYPGTDLELVRDAYELAMVLFSGRFQPSGKSYIAHVVGTASILAALELPASVVAAGLLHNVYNSGDFGDGRSQRSQARRKRIRRAVGSEVETYVARFSELHWESRTIQNARHDPDKLDPMDRTVLLILCADHLEHLLDLDSLYYENTRYYIDHSKIAVEIAEKQALRRLAAELKEAIRVAEFAQRPVDLPATRICNSLFAVAPSSCRMRVSVRTREILIPTVRRLGSKLRRRLTFLCRRSTRFVQSPLRASQRYTIGREAKSTPLGECLGANSEDFRRLFSEDAVLKRVATGFRFTEGPVWVPEEKALLFSDIPANKILKLTADGRVKTFRKPSGNSNGLTRDKEGRLIACEHANRRVTRTERDGSISVLADRFQGKRLNSPNDIVVKSDGAIYFTDPSYGISAAQQEQPVQGVYRLSPDGTQLTLVAGDLGRPNGLAFSPDEKRIYIDDSKLRHIRVFGVQKDGSLSRGSLFHDMNVSHPGAPDGMKVDLEEHVYCTGAVGVWVFDKEGRHLGTIATPEKPSNCAWGDDDRRGLYITAITSVYKIRVNTPGIILEGVCLKEI